MTISPAEARAEAQPALSYTFYDDISDASVRAAMAALGRAASMGGVVLQAADEVLAPTR